MTAPAKAAPKTTPKNADVKDSAPVTDTSTPAVEETKKNRIPELLSDNPILADFCKQYLSVFDEIAKYNKDVLSEKDSDWNAAKVLEKARNMARPTEKGVEPNKKIADALTAWENLINEVARARKSVLDLTSAELGITLSATADRNPELEAPLKEKRKVAIEIGTQLSMIAKMTSDAKASDAVVSFLAENPLPAIGRDQVRSFGNDGKSTPKYRVHVSILKDGTEILSEDGFTKTALALTKPTFGYERGKAPKSEDLRKAWENAGNTPEQTVKSPVEFDDGELHFVITKK